MPRDVQSQCSRNAVLLKSRRHVATLLRKNSAALRQDLAQISTVADLPSGDDMVARFTVRRHRGGRLPTILNISVASLQDRIPIAGLVLY